MMSQRAALSSLFGDDPFFSQDQLLWPMRSEALSSLQQDFFNQRSKLADGLLRELHNGPQLLKFRQFPLISSTLARLSDGTEQQRETSGTELHREPQRAVAENNHEDLLVTLDARGYAPNDITVKLEGRSLAVVAMKQAGAEENQSCSSPSSCASFRSMASSKAGFVQRIDLPAHLDLSGLSCSLMDGGQLRIHAPAANKQPAGEELQGAPSQVGPTEAEPTEAGAARFRTSLEFPITKDKTEQEHTD